MEWLGRVPEHWQLKALRRIFKTLNGSTPRSSEPRYWGGAIPWATPDDLGKLQGTTLQTTERLITQEGYDSCGTSLASRGSLILSTRAPIGHLAIAGTAMCTNQGCRSLMLKGKDNSRYFYYLLIASRSELKSRGQGSTFKELSRTKLESVYLVVPTLPEQLAIAAFLDREIERIDALIAKKERQIELLQEKRIALISHAVTKGLDPNVPMKDSGVAWLGEIPNSWSTPPVKRHFGIQLGKMLQNNPQSEDDILVPYLKALHVLWDRIETRDSPEMYASPSEIRQYGIAGGDLLVCEGGEVGRAGIVISPPTSCIIQNALHRVRAQATGDVVFLQYALQAISSSGWFDVLCNRATIAHFTREKFAALHIPFPPSIQELRAIAAFLDHETGHIDVLIKKVQESISKLREYRTALISAAVTGKIDVREEEEKEKVERTQEVRST